MKPVNEGLYSYTGNGRSNGPYLGYQIKNLIFNGTILADAEIRDHYDDEIITVSSFIKHMNTAAADESVVVTNFPESQKVNITGAKLPFGDVLELVMKWFFASLIASILLGIIAAMFLAIFGGTLAGVAGGFGR